MKRKAALGLLTVIFLIAFWRLYPSKSSVPAVAEKQQKQTEEAPILVQQPEPKHSALAEKDPNQRVREALERYEEAQAKIPEGAVEAQMQELKERTAELASIETPLPSISQETDEQGIKWKRLAYPSGEVRYELVQ